MSFLHQKWSWLLLSTVLLGLILSQVRAAEQSDQAVGQKDEVDLAKVQAGGKVVLISSGGRAGGFRAIDDNNQTAFRFSSDDPRPTLIVQLVDSRPIHRVSTVVGSKSAKIDVYLLNELPRKPTDLDAVKPVASIIDPGVAREASVDFAPQNARYVALRWTLSGTLTGPLNVAEVSAFTHGDSAGIAASQAEVDPPMYVNAGPPPLLMPVSP